MKKPHLICALFAVNWMNMNKKIFLETCFHNSSYAGVWNLSTSIKGNARNANILKPKWEAKYDAEVLEEHTTCIRLLWYEQ